MSTTAFRAALIREIEQSMIIIEASGHPFDDQRVIGYQGGQLDAYAHILQLIKDEDL